MAKYFSWKINDENYAYLYIPGQKKHVSQRITDIDTLNIIIKRISQWDETKFKNAFNSMNEEVNSLFNITIPYSDDYFYGNTNNSMIVMGSSITEKNIMNEFKNEVLDIIDQRFSEIKLYLDKFKEELIQLSNKRTIDTINASKEVYNNTVEELQKVKSEVEIRFNNASKNFEDAAKVIALGNKGIDANAIKELFIQTHSNVENIKEINKNVDTVKNSYETLSEKQQNLSSKFDSIESNVERKVKDLTNSLIQETDDKMEKILSKANRYSDVIVNRVRYDFDEVINNVKKHN